MAEKKKILAVDDESAMRKVLRQFLGTQCCHNVATATNGASALAEVTGATVPYDLVIIDLQMPGMDGEALTVLIRESLPKVPIIWMSGSATAPDIAAKARKHKIKHLLPKPFASSALLHAIQDLCG